MPVETPPTPRFTKQLETELRERASRPPRRRPSLRPVVALAAIGVALAFIVLPSGGDDTGDQASPPPANDSPTAGETFVLERPSRRHPRMTVSIGRLLRADRAEIERLQPEFRKRGAVLTIRERPVRSRSADGEVFSVSHRIPASRRGRDEPFVVDEELGIMSVEIGRLKEKVAPKSGITVVDAFPEVCELIVNDDPAGSLRRLRADGFAVTVVPTEWNNPGVAPKVFSVRDRHGRFNDADASQRALVLVVGPPGEGHTGGVGCAR